jgi:hypothetical protein
VRYERTVCVCLVVYCFLNIAKCMQKKKRISHILLLLTAHSKMQSITSSSKPTTELKDKFSSSLSSAFHQKRTQTKDKPLASIANKLSAINLRATNVQTSRLAPIIRSTIRSTSSLGKKLDLSAKTKPIRNRNPLSRPVYKLSANLVQTYIKINETYFTQQSKMRLRRNEKREEEEPAKKVCDRVY